MPNEFGALHCLKCLRLEWNELKWLPSSINELKLNEFQIGSNPDLRVCKTGLERFPLNQYIETIGEQMKMISDHMNDLIKTNQDFNANGVLDLKYNCSKEFSLDRFSHIKLLDLSGNGLEIVPKDLFTLPRLKSLNLANNKLISLFLDGDDFDKRIKIVVLNISGNRLQSLPQDISSFKSLLELFASNNSLRCLPTGFQELQVQDVFLAENYFNELPVELMTVKKSIRRLSLTGCGISKLPEDVTRLKNLKYLDFSFNKISSVPQTVNTWTQIEVLNLGFNPLERFPDPLSSLSSLVELNLNQTGIQQLPMEFGKLKNLRTLQMEGCCLNNDLESLYRINPCLIQKLMNPEINSLDLSDLQLHFLPKQLYNLTNLTSLNLAGNFLKELPLELGKLGLLRYLDLAGNPLIEPFASFTMKQIIHAVDPNSTTLNLEHAKITTIPMELIRHKSHLMQLKLRNNKITFIPDCLSEIPNLKIISLDGNEIQQLPGDLCRIQDLKILSLSNNKLGKFELETPFIQLQALFLDDNELIEFPSYVLRSSTIKILSIARNQIESLPDGLRNLSQLQCLDLSGNRISYLPSSITLLTKLKVLKCADNQLKEIPESMEALCSLERLDLRYNCLKGDWTEFLIQGKEQINKFIASLCLGSNQNGVDVLDEAESVLAEVYKDVDAELDQIEDSFALEPPVLNPDTPRRPTSLHRYRYGQNKDM
eukprot:g5883.t1